MATGESAIGQMKRHRDDHLVFASVLSGFIPAVHTRPNLGPGQLRFWSSPLLLSSLMGTRRRSVNSGSLIRRYFLKTGNGSLILWCQRPPREARTGAGTDAGCLDHCPQPVPSPDVTTLQEINLGLGLHSATCFPHSAPFQQTRFTDENLEAQRPEAATQGHTAGRWEGSRDLNLGLSGHSTLSCSHWSGPHAVPSVRNALPSLTLPSPPHFFPTQRHCCFPQEPFLSLSIPRPLPQTQDLTAPSL